MTTKKCMMIGCLWLIVFAIVVNTPFFLAASIPLGFALGSFTFPFFVGSSR